ncbi:hypothetical protein COV18_00460 [Candidatus Woesearchaeota archaeon CG10_big_fil_rev_8_21_14_0_10_37_12]|nr:MAG: hypothetical protein COV18_00460 [Candidatus Woesearchaeota archaeon CG10_big_fil_rev_8_21_14_0_10_37_12]
MGTLSVILSAIAPVFGLLAGVIIAYFTKEELKQGEKYFRLLQHVLLSAIFVILFWQFTWQAVILGVILLAALWRFSFDNFLLIPVMALPATVSVIQPLVFVYFIPVGTLLYEQKKELVVLGVVYVLLAVLGSL